MVYYLQAKNNEMFEIKLEAGQKFNGRACKDEKTERTLFGLPLTKDLVYYKKIDGEWQKFDVESFEIVAMYPEWFTFELDNGTRIHSAFFAHMQKPSFINDMKVVTND